MNEYDLITTNTVPPINSDAWMLHTEIVAGRNGIMESFLELGKNLLVFEAAKYYSKFGYDSMRAYLADPDVDITYSTARRCMRVYAAFQAGDFPPVETPELIAAGVAKLDIIRPHVTDETLAELLPMAQSLSKSDLEISIAEMFGTPIIEPDFDYYALRIKRLLWSVQENASEKQKELLKRAYELIQQAEALGKV
jgi:hypothetical protein